MGSFLPFIFTKCQVAFTVKHILSTIATLNVFQLVLYILDVVLQALDIKLVEVRTEALVHLNHLNHQ